MNKKIFGIILSGILLGSFSEMLAQDYAESALLFSRTRPAGSARIQGLGGTQIALGGDYSAASSNPAGLGMFNRSEFTLSTALTSTTTFSDYLGNSLNDNRTVFNIPGMSLVFHMPKEDGKFLGGAFAITLARTNDFNKKTLYSGNNVSTSIVDYFIDQANGDDTDQFFDDPGVLNTPTRLAYDNFLIGPRSILPDPGPDDEYFTDVGYPQEQREEIEVKGATNQWNFSYGGNVDDIFFFGGGIGISSLRYKQQKMFMENFDNPDTITVMQLNESLDIRGSGVNATFGAQVRPVNFLQIGVAYTTPTFYNMTETYEAAMGTRWNDFDYYGDGSEILGDNTNEPVTTELVTSDYNLQVPSKASLGIALISKFGFFTAEVERSNPSNAKYSSETFGISYSGENEAIRSTYKAVTNYRMGAEFRYDIFRVRGGYALQENPYQGGLKAENTLHTISGGLGVRTKSFYVDFALVNNRTKKYYYQPYTVSFGEGPVVDLKTRTTTGVVTVGFTF